MIKEQIDSHYCSDFNLDDNFDVDSSDLQQVTLGENQAENHIVLHERIIVLPHSHGCDMHTILMANE